MESKIHEGQVIAKIAGRDRPCRLQDVRHTMFFIWLTTEGTCAGAVAEITRFAQGMSIGMTVQFGQTLGQQL